MNSTTSYDVPEMKGITNNPIKQEPGDVRVCTNYKQETNTKPDAQGKVEITEEMDVTEDIINETQKWYIQVKIERMPFLEKLISSKKLSILQTTDSRGHNGKLLLESIKKSSICICTNCDIPFKFKQSLYEHKMRVHVGKTFTCEVCDRIFYRQTCLIGHKKYAHSNIRPYPCSICNLSFKTEKAMKRHFLRHVGPGSFKCNFCEKTFYRKDGMEKHRNTTHLQVRGRKKCNLCGKTFHAKQTLINHMMVVHTGVRPYKCDLCDRTFVQSSHYYQHQRDHVSSYVCEICNKTLKTKRSMEAHQQIHAGIKPFSCLTCKKAFRVKRELISHIRIHQPKQFSCDICKKYFRYQSTLKKHRQKHFKALRYKCDLCNVPFMLKKRLDRHIAQDHQVPSFNCEFCSEKFLYRNSVNRHKQRKHFEKMLKNPKA